MKARDEKQNVTLALPKRILRRAKVAAAQRDTSMSAIITRLLEDFLGRSDEYGRAMREELARMNKGFDLGTGGSSTWTRDELHDR